MSRAFLDADLAAGGFEPHCDSWLTGFGPAFSERLAAKGWVAMTWPKRFDGHERTYPERYVVMEEPLAAGAPVAAHGSPIGSRVRSFSATGPRRSTSAFCRRSRAASPSSVRTSPLGERKHEGLSQIIVDLKAPRITVRPIRLISGHAHFNEVIFEDGFVPDEHLVGKEGEGWKQVTSELSYERSGPERFLSTFPLFAETVRELGPNPGVQATRVLGELGARLRALRAISMRVAQRLGEWKEPAVEAALVKDLGTRFEGDLIEAVRLIVPPETAGARRRALYWEAVVQAPGFTLRGGTSEILRGIVAKALTSR